MVVDEGIATQLRLLVCLDFRTLDSPRDILEKITITVLLMLIVSSELFVISCKLNPI